MLGNLIRFAAMFVIMAPTAFAHGDWPPKHGGIISEGGEITFELIRRDDDVVLYVEDHGEAIATEGATGTIQVQSAETTRTVEVKGGGENTLVASGLRFSAGDRIRVRAMLPNRIMLIGRFSIK